MNKELKDTKTLKKQLPTDTVFKLDDSLSDVPKVGMWLAYSINLKEARLIRREQTKVIIKKKRFRAKSQGLVDFCKDFTLSKMKRYEKF